MDSYKSPWPGGYLTKGLEPYSHILPYTYHCSIGELGERATGSIDSLLTRGWRLWLKVMMSTLWLAYFWTMRFVSSSVLNEFIKIKGTLTSFFLFKYYFPIHQYFSSPNQILVTSICRTLKSKKVMPSRTSIADLGPTQPIVVPKPPFNFNTANFSRSLVDVQSERVE